MNYSLGVDLGTTFVAAAISHETQVEMLTLGDRSVVMPAAVYLCDDGTLVTGDVARRRAVISPERVGREFKRRLGDPTPITLGREPYAVTDLMGALLRDVVRKVDETEGAPPEQVVLTHPANWGRLRRGLFREVPRIAGLSDTHTLTITEPEAAAAHYAATRELADGAIVAVYDLGGGTFDATVLRNTADQVEILGTPEGIERLGGVDFDEAILNHVNYTSGGALDELDLRDPQSTVALARLRQDCVLAKEALSVDTEAIIPVFLPGRLFDVRLTRAEFEDLVRAPIESTIGALTRTLRSAQVSPDELSAVLLVGGSSRIPLVSHMITGQLGRPTVIDTHPKYAVALGAATLADLRPRQGVDALVGPPSSPHNAPAGRPPVPAGAAGPVGAPSVLGFSRRVRVGLLSILALAALAGSVAFVSVNQLRMGTTTVAVNTAAVASPTEVEIRPSVPVPSLGSAIPVGATPGFVAVSPNGRLAYIANRDAGVITVVDTSINQVIATVPVDAGPPRFLAFAPDGRRVYVSIFNEQRTIRAVGVLDSTTNKIVATIPVRSRPFLAAVSPDGRWLYVPNHDSGTVSVVDTANNTVAKEIKVAANPHWVEFSPDGTRAYTANHESNLISVLDTSTNTVIAQVRVQTSPHSVAVHPTRPLVANVNYDANSVTMIDTTSNQVVATIGVGKNPQDITWAPDGRFAYVANVADGTVSVIDAESNKVTATIPVGRSPTSVAVLPNGRDAYVTNLASNTLSVLHISG